MRRLLLLSVVGVFMLASSPCRADIPHLINYQGMLSEDEGSPLNGSYDLTFSIYGQSSGGSSLWTESQSGVSVENGLFNVILGSVTPIPSSVFEDTLRYLGIAVGSDSKLAPRIRLTSVAYAYRSEIADTAIYAVEAVTAESDSDWTISGIDMYSAVSGDVGIGTTTPSAKLDVEVSSGGAATIGSSFGLHWIPALWKSLRSLMRALASMVMVSTRKSVNEILA